MPYPRHWRLVFGGTLYGTEQWSCSLRIGDMTGNNRFVPESQTYKALNGDAALTDVSTDVQTFFKSAGTGIPSYCNLTFVKFNEIDPDGRYADKARTRAVYFTTPVTPSATSNVAVPQAAIAVTLHSDATRGILTRGRFYLPTGWNPQSTSSPLLGSTNATSLANATKTFLTNLANWPGVDFTDAGPVLASPGGRGRPEGGLSRVRAVSVGQVIDTQQRRRQAFPESPIRVAL